MNKDPEIAVNQSFGGIRETSRLLSELELALDQSTILRNLTRRRDQLHQLERLTGPSLKTRSLRAQIFEMEQSLRTDLKTCAHS